MNAAPVAAVALGFVSVMVSTLVSLVPTDAGAKLFAAVIEFSTPSREVAATVFEPALVVVTAPIASVLVYVAAVLLVTLTVTVQEPLAGIVPPVSATVLPPFVAVTVPPVHVVAPAGVALLTRLAGYVSVNAAPVIGDAFEFDSVMVRTVVEPGAIEVGEKAFATVGCARTFNVAVAAAAAPALVVVTTPVVLMYAPAVVDVTFTVTVHEPFAGTVRRRVQGSNPRWRP